MGIPSRPGPVWSVLELAATCAGWGVWIAVGGMPPVRRRAARAGVLVLVTGASTLDPTLRSSEEVQAHRPQLRPHLVRDGSS